MTYLLYWYK